MKTGSSIAGALVLPWLLAACAGGATLLQQTERGGIAAYPYVPQRGPMVSSFRRDALKLMDEHCRGRYRIVREGEARGRDRVTSTAPGSEEVVRDYRWGIQYECQ